MILKPGWDEDELSTHGKHIPMTYPFVPARDRYTGVERWWRRQAPMDVSDKAVELMIADPLEHAFEDMSGRVFTDAKLKANELLPTVALGAGAHRRRVGRNRARQ